MTAADLSDGFRAGERAPRLVLRFAVFTAVGLALAAGAIVAVVRQAYTVQAERQAIDRTRFTVDSVLVERLHASDLAAPVSAMRRRQLDHLFASRVLLRDAVAGTLYGATGRVTYSTHHRLIGTRVRSSRDVETALSGQVASRVIGSGAERVLTTDVPVAIGNRHVGGVIAIEHDYAPIAAAARRSSLLIAGVLEALLLLLLVILVPVLARASRRIRDHLAELDHVATHDELTGLPNRIGFRRVFRDTQKGRAVDSAVLLVDIDGFHEINDALGSRNGDQLLCQVAERLQQGLGERGRIARVGEDEFAVLLHAHHHSEIQQAAQQLRDALTPPPGVDGVRVAIDVNIGAASATHQDPDLEPMLRRASLALTAAKANHTRLEIHDTQHDQADATKLQLTTELREALAAQQLAVYYQPQADLSTRAIRGVEALIRWNHPQRGLLAAGDFIALAERTGVITEIGRFVLDSATHQWHDWNAGGTKLDLAVNLAAVDFLDPHLPDEIAALLERNSVPPEYLVLEITERALLRDERRTGQMLDRLTQTGVRLAIDDYGTGYSSLSYLHRFPINQVKLDRSFIADITTNPNSATIIRSTIELAHNLGATVVAEGIETPEQWHQLANLGCDIAQGYLIGKAMPARDLEHQLVVKPRQVVAVA